MSHRLQDQWHHPLLLYQDSPPNHLCLQDKVRPNLLLLQDKHHLQDKCILLHNHPHPCQDRCLHHQDKILRFQDKGHLLLDKWYQDRCLLLLLAQQCSLQCRVNFPLLITGVHLPRVWLAPYHLHQCQVEDNHTLVL